jgi:hypothetical protein
MTQPANHVELVSLAKVSRTTASFIAVERVRNAVDPFDTITIGKLGQRWHACLHHRLEIALAAVPVTTDEISFAAEGRCLGPPFDKF